MIAPLYTHTHSPRSRLVLLSIEDGIGIFEDVSTPGKDRVKCPFNSTYVIPHAERSEVIGPPGKIDLTNHKWAYDTLCGGDGGASNDIAYMVGAYRRDGK